MLLLVFSSFPTYLAFLILALECIYCSSEYNVCVTRLVVQWSNVSYCHVSFTFNFTESVHCCQVEALLCSAAPMSCISEEALPYTLP